MRKKLADKIVRLLTIAAIVGQSILLMGCPPIAAVLSRWTQSVKNGRDALMANSPDLQDRGLVEIRIPFGWSLTSQPRRRAYVTMVHVTDATAEIVELRSDAGVTVAWRVAFRRNGQRCVNTGGFSAPAMHVEDSAGPLVQTLPLSNGIMYVRRMFVYWPDEEADRFGQALILRRAPCESPM